MTAPTPATQTTLADYMDRQIDILAAEWGSLPSDVRPRLIVECPRLYFAMARLARRRQVENEADR